MSNFRTRILGLAAVASAFAGMSFGQVVTCTTGAQTNPTLRAEGQTELLAQMVVTCTNTAGGAATSGTVYIQTSLPITSKQFTAAGVPTNEATLVVSGAGTAGTVQGVVSGNQVSFQLPAGAIPAGAASAIFTISNIRVNASTGGAPQVTESGVLSYSVLGPPVTSSNTAIPASTQGAGFILKTLGPAVLTAPGITQNYATCVGNAGSAVAAPGISFEVNINELVSGAFLTQNVALEPNEQGQVVAAPNIGTAASGDIINVTLNNVPSAATIYVPQTVAVGGTTLTVANAAPITTGAIGALPIPQVAFTPTGNTVVIPYTVTTATVAGPLTFLVDVRMAFAANAVPAQGPVTVSVAYGPSAAALTGPATTVPTFLAGTPVTVNASSITICQTSLLFPFVTNTLGFDTGLVIANTSTDNLNLGGKSIAAAQTGTCNLSFYGTGAPTPATGVADPGGNLASGTTHAFLLSAVAPGFQGYVIATCPFQFAHGFGFLAYNLTQSSGAVEGYIAEVMTRANIFAAASTNPDPITF